MFRKSLSDRKPMNNSIRLINHHFVQLHLGACFHSYATVNHLSNLKYKMASREELLSFAFLQTLWGEKFIQSCCGKKTTTIFPQFHGRLHLFRRVLNRNWWPLNQRLRKSKTYGLTVYYLEKDNCDINLISFLLWGNKIKQNDMKRLCLFF